MSRTMHKKEDSSKSESATHGLVKLTLTTENNDVDMQDAWQAKSVIVQRAPLDEESAMSDTEYYEVRVKTPVPKDSRRTTSQRKSTRYTFHKNLTLDKNRGAWVRRRSVTSESSESDDEEVESPPAPKSRAETISYAQQWKDVLKNRDETITHQCEEIQSLSKRNDELQASLQAGHRHSASLFGISGRDRHHDQQLAAKDAELQRLKPFEARYAALQAENNRLRQQNDSQSRLKPEQERTLKGLRNDLSNANATIKSHETHIAHLSSLNDRGSKEFEALRVSSQGKDIRISQLEYDIEEERKKRQQTARNAEKLQTSMRTIQENAFKDVESAKWMPRSASDITRELTGLLAEIKQWSKRHSIDYIMSVDSVEKTLRPRSCLGKQELVRTALHNRKIGAWMFLSAAIAADAFCRILFNPFFAFHHEDDDDDDHLSKRDAKTMERLLDVIWKGMNAHPSCGITSDLCGR
jgi:hypothetical protein